MVVITKKFITFIKESKYGMAGNSGIADNLFTGATISNGAVTIPSGTITSYIPTDLDVANDADGGASEFVFGMRNYAS